MGDEPIACDIRAIRAGERNRHLDLAAQWQDAVDEVMELPNGYAFRFAPDIDILMDLAEFVSRERVCCPFFHFEIAVEANRGPVWLRLLGSEKVKAFIQVSVLGQ